MLAVPSGISIAVNVAGGGTADEVVDVRVEADDGGTLWLLEMLALAEVVTPEELVERATGMLLFEFVAGEDVVSSEVEVWPLRERVT